MAQERVSSTVVLVSIDPGLNHARGVWAWQKTSKEMLVRGITS